MTTDTPHGYELLEGYRDYLLMVARGMMGVSYRGKIDAEELVNQALFQAYQQQDQFRGSTEGERIAWLKTIVQNQMHDALRYLHRDKRDVDKERRLAVRDWDQSCSSLMSITGGLTSPSRKAVKHEQQLLLAAALAKLPEQQRTSVEFRHLHGCSVVETAEAMGCSRGSVAGRVNSIAFNPDGTQIASANEDHSLKLWNSTTGKELLTITGHTDSVNGVAFNPDGTRIASASSDRTVKLWDAVSGKEVLTLNGQRAAFSPFLGAWLRVNTNSRFASSAKLNHAAGAVVFVSLPLNRYPFFQYQLPPGIELT